MQTTPMPWQAHQVLGDWIVVGDIEGDTYNPVARIESEYGEADARMIVYRVTRLDALAESHAELLAALTLLLDATQASAYIASVQLARGNAGIALVAARAL